MAILTLDRVLSEAERLPADEQRILEDLLHKRRVETWRTNTASEAKKAAAALRAGKLKPESVEAVIARLREAE